MAVYVAESLTKNKEIAFNAGTHTEIIRLNFADYQSLVKPRNFNSRGKQFLFRAIRWKDGMRIIGESEVKKNRLITGFFCF